MNMKINLYILILLSFNAAAQTEIENGLLPAVIVEGEETRFTIYDRMDHYAVPGVSIAVVEGGELKWAKGYGYANTNDSSFVDSNTLFQAGSISKPIFALAALKLVDNGTIDLDQDVNNYLKTWKIPENSFTDSSKVTLRKLLTHTAGINVHGFPGYSQTDTFPSIDQVLNGKGNTAAIMVDTVPGSIWRYSGGGYTIAEKLVEDQSGLPLEQFILSEILLPIGMVHSTYMQPLNKELHHNVSAAYNSRGEMVDGLWHNYPERAAAGLWTTPSDLSKYCIEIQDILSKKKNGVLSYEIVVQMLTKYQNGWGLGPSLQGENDSLIFQHGGKNAGFTNNMIAFAHQGNAVIVMTNGDNGNLLIREILRAVSTYYQWGISEAKYVRLVKEKAKNLNTLTGTYLYEHQVPGIGDYFIEVKILDGNLVVVDTNQQDEVTFMPLGDNRFIDLNEGMEIEIKKGDKMVLTWDQRHVFIRQD